MKSLLPVLALKRIKNCSFHRMVLYRNLSSLRYGDELYPIHENTQRVNVRAKEHQDALLVSDSLLDKVKGVKVKSFEGFKHQETKVPRLLSSIPTGQIAIEGVSLIKSAIEFGCQLKTVYFTNRNVLQRLPHVKENVEFVHIKHSEMKKISNLKTSQGILALCTPSERLLRNSSHDVNFWRPLPVILILDGLSDPSNVGSLLRCAVFFGCDEVILMRGSASIWNHKALQAGMGAQFGVLARENVSWDELFKRFHSNVLQVHVADNCLGLTEEHGLKSWQGAHAMATSNSTPEDLEQELYLDLKDDDDCVGEDLSCQHAQSNGDSSLAYRLPLRTLPHFAMNYFKRPASQLTLILGNESRGVSPEAYHLSHSTGGCRLFIPSHPVMNSTNVGFAASIILGEMQRQLLLHQEVEKPTSVTQKLYDL